MKLESNSSFETIMELDLLFLIPTLFAITQAHDRFLYFVETIIDLLDHMCSDTDPEWERYSRLVREGHRTGLSDIRARVLYQEMLYVSTHHTFPSSCAQWKFQSLNIFTRSEEQFMMQSSDCLNYIDNTLSYMEDEPETEVAMCDFVLARLKSLADEIGINAADWLQPPKPAQITDEMVDAWIEQNPETQKRLREFGL